MSVIREEIYIGGMTCINCQNKIEQVLNNLPGVQKAAVSYQNGTARITYDPNSISRRQIEREIEKLYYQVLSNGQADGSDMIRSVCLLAIMIALYVLLQQFRILNLLVPNQLAVSGMGFGMLFVVGLLTSVHCIAMRGGINLSQCLPPLDAAGKQTGSAFLPSLLYNAGRVTSYTIIGFLLGMVGMLIVGGAGAGIPLLLQGILKLFAGTVMVITGLNMLEIFPWLRWLNPHLPKFLTKRFGAKRAATRKPFIIGLFNGLMPCGPLQSMQILAFASGNPLTGALSMLLFSLGTVPLMLGLGTIVSALGKRFAYTVMNVGAVLVAVLGLAMLSQGGTLSGILLPDRLLFWIVALAVLGVAVSIPISKTVYRLAVVSTSVVLIIGAGIVLQRFVRGNAVGSGGSTVQIVDGAQLVDSTLTPGQYPTIMVQPGMPVRWTILAPEGSVNGCNYRVVIREYGIEHDFTEGENIIEFIPAATGTVLYSCWMGMIQGSIIVTE